MLPAFWQDWRFVCTLADTSLNLVKSLVWHFASFLLMHAAWQNIYILFHLFFFFFKVWNKEFSALLHCAAPSAGVPKKKYRQIITHSTVIASVQFTGRENNIFCKTHDWAQRMEIIRPENMNTVKNNLGVDSGQSGKFHLQLQSLHSFTRLCPNYAH